MEFWAVGDEAKLNLMTTSIVIDQLDPAGLTKAGVSRDVAGIFLNILQNRLLQGRISLHFHMARRH